MVSIKNILVSTGIALLALFSTSVMAERAKTFDDYVVHYNALSTDLLTPEIARQYNIKRSKNRAMLNISVQKKSTGLMGQPVGANIEVTAMNLTGQTRAIETRKVKEGNAIYYIGDFYVGNKESLDFNINVKPEGENASYQVSFRQQFFTD